MTYNSPSRSAALFSQLVTATPTHIPQQLSMPRQILEMCTHYYTHTSRYSPPRPLRSSTFIKHWVPNSVYSTGIPSAVVTCNNHFIQHATFISFHSARKWLGWCWWSTRILNSQSRFTYIRPTTQSPGTYIRVHAPVVLLYTPLPLLIRNRSIVTQFQHHQLPNAI